MDPSYNYDKYYQTENLFGNPYSILLTFFATYQKRGEVLDLGCGQGRDAIPLARLGFNVTGIDHSKLGIDQMNKIAKREKIPLIGIVADIFTYLDLILYDFVLCDNIFHFEKKDREKEITLIDQIVLNIKNACVIVFCIQDTTQRLKVLNRTIDLQKQLVPVIDEKFVHIFEDPQSGHKSKCKYKIIAVKKESNTYL